MRKLTPARDSYRDDFFILYRVYIMTESFHISLFEGTLHVDKIQVWFKIANITRALPIPVYRQTDFTPKRVVVLRLHDTAVRFCTRVKFLPRYKNRGDSRLHDILWWYHVNKYRAMTGIRSELAPGQKLKITPIKGTYSRQQRGWYIKVMKYLFHHLVTSWF